MERLPKKTCQNGIGYTLVGDYYIPDLQLPEGKPPHWDLGSYAQSLSGAVPSSPL